MKILTLLFMYKLTEIYGLRITKEETAMLHLQKFGYLDEATNYRSSSSITEENVITALKEFQRFAGLNQTGILDRSTVRVMSAPRCGNKDIVGTGAKTRKKRYTHQGSKWKGEELTYTISKYPSRIKNTDIIDKEIARAFKVWSDVTDIKFVEMKRRRVNIDIRFEEGEHGDGNPFDGPSKILAHAFAPNFGGDAHFDDDETWTVNRAEGTNIFQVAAHEFGHNLGLEHSDTLNALMYPRYLSYNSRFKLHIDDISAIQSLYGPKNSGRFEEIELTNFSPNKQVGELPQSTEKPSIDRENAPDLCKDGTIDTVTRTEDGSTYVFKGDYYWKINNGISKGYPRVISEDWGNMEGSLDASFTWATGHTFFFKKTKYWRFTNKIMDPHYPKEISVGFTGIPSDLDAAFIWSGNGKLYFFKDTEYWQFDSHKDPPISSEYPRPIGNWLGVPTYIDAAFQWENSRTYFFKDDKYYAFNDVDFKVAHGKPPYPRPNSVWWFNC